MLQNNDTSLFYVTTNFDTRKAVRKFSSVILSVLVLAIVNISCTKSHDSYTRNSEKGLVVGMKIIIYHSGKSAVINCENFYFKILQKEVEEFLISSNNVLYELVAKETISKIKGNRAVEVIYTEPKEVKVNNPVYWQKLIKVDRILLPLEGYYSPNVIFWGYKSYSSGPFLNDRGNDRIEKIKGIIRNIKNAKKLER